MRSPLISIQKLNNITPISDLLEISKICLKLGRLNQSLTIAYAAVQKDQSQQQFYKNYYIQSVRVGAEFAEEIGDYSRAAYHWEQLTQQLPQDAGAWYGLGLAKANLQEYQGAEIALNHVVQLEPGNQKARSHLREIQQLIRG